MPTVTLGGGQRMFVNVFLISSSFKYLRSDGYQIPSSLKAVNALGVMAHTITWVNNISIAGLLKALESMVMVSGAVYDK